MADGQTLDIEISPGQQIRRVTGLVKQNWFTIFTFLALGVLVGVALFNFLPKEYESETKIMLRNTYLFGAGEAARKEENLLVNRAKLLEEELKSSSWIEKVLDRLEWPEWATAKVSTTARREFVDRVKSRLSVDIKRGETAERLIFITFSYTDRWKARDLCQRDS